MYIREAAKKVFLLMAGPLSGGGEGPGHQGKNTFFGKKIFQHSKVTTSIKLEVQGGGGVRP